MKKRLKKIIAGSIFFLSTPALFLTSCSSQETTQFVDVSLRSQSTPIAINKSKTRLNQDFFAILSTIESHMITLNRVEIGGSVLKSNDYTFTPTTGELIVPSNFVTGNVVIYASALEMHYSIALSSESDKDITLVTNQLTRHQTTTIDIVYSSQKLVYVDYVLVDNQLISSHNYWYSSETRKLKIRGESITGNVIVSVVSAPQKLNHTNEDIFQITGGSKNIEILYRSHGQDSKKWRALLNGEDITSQTKLRIFGISSEYISISNDGIVSWNHLLEPGEYLFKVLGVYENTKTGEVLEAYSDYVHLTVRKTSEFYGGSKNIESPVNFGGYDDKKWCLYYGGKNVIEDSELSIRYGTSQIHITNDGRVYWDDTLPVGVYEFTVFASYTKGETPLEYEENVILKIDTYFSINGGSTNLQGYGNVAGSDYKYWAAFIAKGFVLPRFELQGDNLSEIYIDQYGLVHWTNQIKLGRYSFCIKASYVLDGKTYTVNSEQIALQIS